MLFDLYLTQFFSGIWHYWPILSFTSFAIMTPVFLPHLWQLPEVILSSSLSLTILPIIQWITKYCRFYVFPNSILSSPCHGHCLITLFSWARTIGLFLSLLHFLHVVNLLLESTFWNIFLQPPLDLCNLLHCILIICLYTSVNFTRLEFLEGRNWSYLLGHWLGQGGE